MTHHESHLRPDGTTFPPVTPDPPEPPGYQPPPVPDPTASEPVEAREEAPGRDAARQEPPD